MAGQGNCMGMNAMGMPMAMMPNPMMMNPMLGMQGMGMMPMMPNPMMMMAGMMAGAMRQNCMGSEEQAAGVPAAAAEGPSSEPSSPGSDCMPDFSKSEENYEGPMDADVRKLGEHFNIEDRWILRLDELMRRRRDTKEQDLAKLYEVLEQARSPTGLLVAKLGEMECGQFVGKVKPDRNIERIAIKYKLDARVISRLTELRVRRKKTAAEDLNRLEQHMSLCKRPSATATLLIGKLLEGELRQVPDVSAAKALAQKFKLDKDAKSKLREVAERRSDDVDEAMAHLEKTLQMSHQPSATLCKIAKTLMEGGKKRSEEEKYANDSDREQSPGEDSHRSKSPGAGSDCSSDSSSIRRRRALLKGSRSRSRGKKKRKRKKDAAGQPGAPSAGSAAKVTPAHSSAPKPGAVQVGSASGGGWTTHEW